MADYAPQSWDAAPYRGEIRPYDPSWSERLTNWMMGDKRPSPERRRAAEGLTNLAEMTPVGMLTALNDLYRAQKSGDTGGQMFAAAGAMPIPGAKLAAKEAKALAKTMPALPATAAADSAEGAAMAAQRARFSEPPASAEGWQNLPPLVSDKGKGPLWHPVSETKMRQPLEDLKIIYGTPHAEVAPVSKVWTPEDLQIGDHIVTIVGDRAATGRTIAGIGDNQFENPVRLYGGPEFGLSKDNPGQFWASEFGAADKFYKKLMEHADRTGAPPMLMYSGMGPQSTDFNTMSTELVREMMKHAPVTKHDKQVFDLAFAAQHDPKFPGVDKLDDEWVAGAGERRKALVKMMALKQWQEKGFPDIAAVRAAQTVPELLNMPANAMGFAMGRADPSIRSVVEGSSKHPTYNTGIPAEHIGQMDMPYPREMVMRDWWALRKSDNPSLASHLRSIGYGVPAQKVDQQLIDTMSAYREAERGKR